MKTALRIGAALVLAVVLAVTFAACAPQERMDAYVKLEHPNAWTIGRFNSDGGAVESTNGRELYVLCDQGTIRLIFVDRGNFSADILKDVALNTNHASCR